MKITDLELKILKVIWNNKDRASVQDILDRWHDSDLPKYTTVLKILQILEKKGIVRHEKKGRSYDYIPLISKADTEKFNIKDLIKNLFNEDKIAFAQTFISKNDFSAHELRELKKLIAEKERDTQDGHA